MALGVSPLVISAGLVYLSQQWMTLGSQKTDPGVCVCPEASHVMAKLWRIPYGFHIASGFVLSIKTFSLSSLPNFVSQPMRKPSGVLPPLPLAIARFGGQHYGRESHLFLSHSGPQIPVAEPRGRETADNIPRRELALDLHLTLTLGHVWVKVLLATCSGLSAQQRERCWVMGSLRVYSKPSKIAFYLQHERRWLVTQMGKACPKLGAWPKTNNVIVR